MWEVFRKIFIIGVIGILFLPFLLAHRQENRIAEDENRYYANFPSLLKNSGINKEYTSEFDVWIADNARFRTTMKNIKVELLYKLFGKLELEDVAIGKNNELYGVTSDIVDAIQGRSLLKQEELELYETKLYNLQNWLKKKEIDFFFMNAYDKYSIYPENFPQGVKQYGELYIGAQTERYINEKGRVNIVPIYGMLREEAKDKVIYYQYVDWCHWNDVGMFIGYQKLMDAIQDKKMDINYLGMEDVEQIQLFDKRKVYGFEYPFEEQSIYYDIRNKNAVELEIANKEKYSYKEHSHYLKNENEKYKVLVLNDSFVRMGMKNYLAESFRETLSLDIHNLNKIEMIVCEYQPDVVILETYEMNIPFLYDELKKLECISDNNE